MLIGLRDKSGASPVERVAPRAFRGACHRRRARGATRSTGLPLLMPGLSRNRIWGFSSGFHAAGSGFVSAGFSFTKSGPSSLTAGFRREAAACASPTAGLRFALTGGHFSAAGLGSLEPAFCP